MECFTADRRRTQCRRQLRAQVGPAADSLQPASAHRRERKPVGVIDWRSIEVDCNSAIDAGLYTFTFGHCSVVKARYTFMYKWNGKQWLITSHHSSMMPESN
jgi:hypothetical protein